MLQFWTVQNNFCLIGDIANYNHTTLLPGEVEQCRA